MHRLPSELLKIENSYVAYCLDEAGAFLMNQEKPPNYARLLTGENIQGLNKNKQALLLLRECGGKVDI